MRPGDYTVTISGPRGVVFDAVVGLSGRNFARLAIDDEALQELLVVTSVCAGAIDAELITQKRLSQGGPGAAGRPGDTIGCVGDETPVPTKRPAEILTWAMERATMTAAEMRDRLAGGALANLGGPVA